MTKYYTIPGFARYVAWRDGKRIRVKNENSRSEIKMQTRPYQFFMLKNDIGNPSKLGVKTLRQMMDEQDDPDYVPPHIEAEKDAEIRRGYIHFYAHAEDGMQCRHDTVPTWVLDELLARGHLVIQGITAHLTEAGHAHWTQVRHCRHREQEKV